MFEKTVVITNKTGLHSRPAAQFVEMANRYKSKIILDKEGKKADAKSIIGVLSLGAGNGSSIKIIADGFDEHEAVNKLAELINSFQD